MSLRPTGMSRAKSFRSYLATVSASVLSSLSPIIIIKGWRRAVSRAWNGALLPFLKNNPLLRLSIHPPDYSHPVIWRQILRLVDRSNETRTPTTYRDWVAERRLMTGHRG